MPHNEEPQLRKLGLTTRMNRGVPTLDVPHKICEQGKKLTPEQSQLLKLLGHKTVEFKVKLLGRWEKETGNVIIEPVVVGDPPAGESDDGGGDDSEEMSD
jgi:mRNA turnover protein 4